MAREKPMFCWVLICVLLSFVLTQAAPPTALVTKLPGFNGTFPSKHYSGYDSFLLMLLLWFMILFGFSWLLWNFMLVLDFYAFLALFSPNKNLGVNDFKPICQWHCISSWFLCISFPIADSISMLIHDSYASCALILSDFLGGFSWLWEIWS